MRSTRNLLSASLGIYTSPTTVFTYCSSSPEGGDFCTPTIRATYSDLAV